jgi:biopolymer transport protein ExbB
MRTILACALVLTLSLPSYSRDKKKEAAFDVELARLTEMIEAVRDSLEAEIAARYSFKQHTVEQRELDKEEYDRQREKQENALTNLSKIKEEALVREQNLGEANKNAKDKQAEWAQVKNSFDEMLQKEADGIMEVFPADLERRRSDLEEVRRVNREKQDPLYGWDLFLRYKTQSMAAGRTVSIMQQKLLPNDGAPRMFSIARFGNVFAYCMDTSRQIYMIRQTGRLGKDRFSIETVLSPEFKGFLLETLPLWIQKNKVSGQIMGEVMQNEQARILVTGEKKSWTENLYHRLKAGGWVMIPLLMLPFWVIGLVGHKGLQFYMRPKRYKTNLKTAFGYIDQNQTAQALDYAKSQKGLMARVLEACLTSQNSRDHAEQAVRKLIMQEVPVFNRGINTVAVIAGASPLLGLLGTISGMIALFAAVTYYGTGDPKFLAGGISEALITALTGLAIAICSLFLHELLRSRKERLLSEVEMMAYSALDKIVPEP